MQAIYAITKPANGLFGGAQMFLVYFGEVLKRAFTPTPRITDALQVVAASALPAIASFAGVKLPTTAGSEVFAYIGLAALSYFAIRLFWAPYAMWREQIGQVADLKSELSRPERLELERRAELMAEDRRTAIHCLVDLFTYSFLLFHDGKWEAQKAVKNSDQACDNLSKIMYTYRDAWGVIEFHADFLRYAARIEDGVATDMDIRAMTSVFNDLLYLIAGHKSVRGEDHLRQLPSSNERSSLPQVYPG